MYLGDLKQKDPKPAYGNPQDPLTKKKKSRISFRGRSERQTPQKGSVGDRKGIVAGHPWQQEVPRYEKRGTALPRGVWGFWGGVCWGGLFVWGGGECWGGCVSKKEKRSRDYLQRFASWQMPCCNFKNRRRSETVNANQETGRTSSFKGREGNLLESRAQKPKSGTRE